MGFVGGFLAELAGQVIGWVIETTAAMVGVIIGWILDSPDGALEASAMQAMIRQGLAVGRYVLPLMVLLGVIQAGVQGRPGAVARRRAGSGLPGLALGDGERTRGGKLDQGVGEGDRHVRLASVHRAPLRGVPGAECRCLLS